MVTGDFWVLFAMLLYFIVVVIIGFIYAKKSNRSTEEYFLGGRSLGPWLTALSAEASDMSGYLLMGLPGLAYFCGANEAVWTAIGLAIGTYLNWKFVAKRLRKYSEVAGNAITIPDFFSNRFHDKKNILMTIAAVIILLFFSIYVGSCFVTCGKLFATLFGLDYATMMVLGALVVFLYTFVGGYLAVSTTDLIQGTIMICALVIVFVGSVAQAGGVENTVAFLNSLPGFLNGTQQAVPIVDTSGNQLIVDGLPAFGEPTEYGIIAIISCLAWGLGYFGMPHILLRFMAIEEEKKLVLSRRIATVWVLISMCVAILIGIIGYGASVAGSIPMFTTSSQSETVIIQFAHLLGQNGFLLSLVAGVVLAGILACTMSTADSQLLTAASGVSQNLLQDFLKIKMSTAASMNAARLTVMGIAIVAVFLAWNPDSSVFTIVSFAWAGFGASFGPLVLFALFWRRTNMQGALAGMLTGGVMVFVWKYLVRPLGGNFNIYELLPAFVLSCLAIVIVSLLTKEPSKEIYDEFDSVGK